MTFSDALKSLVTPATAISTRYRTRRARRRHLSRRVERAEIQEILEEELKRLPPIAA